MVPYNKTRARVQMSPISFTSHGNSKGNRRCLHAGYKTLDSAWKKISWVVKCLIWLRWVQTKPTTEIFTQESNEKFTSAEKVTYQTSMSQSPITLWGKLPIYIYIYIYILYIYIYSLAWNKLVCLICFSQASSLRKQTTFCTHHHKCSHVKSGVSSL